MKTSAEKCVCPNCEALGTIGTPCTEPVCQKRGYHFIPEEYFPNDVDDPTDHLDPYIGKRVGEYLIVGLLGVGGYGHVYLSLQLPILLKSAFKLLRTDGLPDSITEKLNEKFESEAKALSQLNHPNIVRLIQFGKFRDLPYLVMEYVEGGTTLSDETRSRAESNRDYSIEELKNILGQLLDAIEAAHSQGIIHRDVKPDNIMIQNQVGYPMLLRVLDFGLAKFTMTGQSTVTLAGTPDYMAPEQFTQSNLGPWTDLYAVGTIAFELITGQKPFTGEGIQEIFFHKLNASYSPLKNVPNFDPPLSVSRFFTRALSSTPEKRYQNVTEFSRNLDTALSTLEGNRPKIDLMKLYRSGAEQSGGADGNSTQRMEITDSKGNRAKLSRSAAYDLWLENERKRIEYEARHLDSIPPNKVTK